MNADVKYYSPISAWLPQTNAILLERLFQVRELWGTLFRRGWALWPRLRPAVRACIHTALRSALTTDRFLNLGLDGEKGRKEMFYLTTLSTHFIYSYME